MTRITTLLTCFAPTVLLAAAPPGSLRRPQVSQSLSSIPFEHIKHKNAGDEREAARFVCTVPGTRFGSNY